MSPKLYFVPSPPLLPHHLSFLTTSPSSSPLLPHHLSFLTTSLSSPPLLPHYLSFSSFNYAFSFFLHLSYLYHLSHLTHLSQANPGGGKTQQPDGSLPVGGIRQLGVQDLSGGPAGASGRGRRHHPPQEGVGGR